MKWRDKDRKKLAQYVRKFNASLTKILKEHPELESVLPERLTVEGVKQTIYSRSDFNKFLKKIDRWFTQPEQRKVVELEGGIKRTLWEKRNVQYGLQSIEARKKAQKKKAPFGEYVYKKENQQELDYNKTQKKIHDLLENAETEEDIQNAYQLWLNFVKKVDYEQSSEWDRQKSIKYYNSYLKAIRNNFTPENAERIIQKIKEIGALGSDLFAAALYDDTLYIDYVYLFVEEDERADYIIEALEMMKVNNDKKED